MLYNVMDEFTTFSERIKQNIHKHIYTLKYELKNDNQILKSEIEILKNDNKMILDALKSIRESLKN